MEYIKTAILKNVKNLNIMYKREKETAKKIHKKVLTNQRKIMKEHFYLQERPMAWKYNASKSNENNWNNQVWKGWGAVGVFIVALGNGEWENS